MIRHQCTLVVRDHAKPIPYGAEDREVSVNQGFVPLKGVADAPSRVPETTGDAGLAYAVARLNEAQTAFFTVGCEKAINEHEGKFWKRGYVEFAFNTVQGVSDARNYFFLFFHLSSALHVQSPRQPIWYQWELEGAYFERCRVSGLSAAVWINTELEETTAKAEATWERAVRYLVDFLISQQVSGGTPIY